jgi:hypothetical protein
MAPVFRAPYRSTISEPDSLSAASALIRRCCIRRTSTRAAPMPHPARHPGQRHQHPRATQRGALRLRAATSAPAQHGTGRYPLAARMDRHAASRRFGGGEVAVQRGFRARLGEVLLDVARDCRHISARRVRRIDANHGGLGAARVWAWWSLFCQDAVTPGRTVALNNRRQPDGESHRDAVKPWRYLDRLSPTDPDDNGRSAVPDRPLSAPRSRQGAYALKMLPCRV